MATARSGRYMPYLGDKFANSNLIATPLFLPNRRISCYTRKRLVEREIRLGNQKGPLSLRTEGLLSSKLLD